MAQEPDHEMLNVPMSAPVLGLGPSPVIPVSIAIGTTGDSREGGVALRLRRNVGTGSVAGGAVRRGPKLPERS